MLIRKAHFVAGLLAFALLFGGPAAAITHAQAPDQVARQATFGNLIAALNNISVQIEHLEALNDLDIEDVQVVNVEDVLNGNNIRALNRALNRNEVEINVLQDFLNNSLNDNVVTIRNVLNDLEVDVDVDDVIAINVLDDGTVIVFYQD